MKQMHTQTMGWVRRAICLTTPAVLIVLGGVPLLAPSHVQHARSGHTPAVLALDMTGMRPQIRIFPPAGSVVNPPRLNIPRPMPPVAIPIRPAPPPPMLSPIHR